MGAAPPAPAAPGTHPPSLLPAAHLLKPFTMSNPIVFFDIEADGKPLGRIEMTVTEGGRRADGTPRTARPSPPAATFSLTFTPTRPLSAARRRGAQDGGELPRAVHRCAAGWAAAAAIRGVPRSLPPPRPHHTTGEKGVGKVSGKPLHFKGSTFHRVINE